MSTPGTSPEWAARLREERKAKVGTVADMARRLKEAAGEQRGRLPSIDDLTRTIRGWERGDHYPSERYRLLYARALRTTEAGLFDLVERSSVPVPALPLPSVAPDADLFERITRSVQQPGRVDQRTVGWLAICLAEHRKVEDTIGARPLLGIVRSQLGVVVELAQHARGSLADTVVDLAAQYAQFVAWMSLDVDDQAAEHADDEPVWMYFYDETWFRLQRGMTELHLANWPKAIDLLTDGLSGLPESYKRDRAWYGSCLAKAHAEAGDAAAAVQVSLPIVADAVELNRHATKELVNVATLLTRRKAPQAADLKEALVAGRTDH
ncbi:XRE family transcriptional regulator [Streptosporangium sp. NPDC003464]